MNTGGLLTVSMLLLGFSLAGAFLITMTLGAVRRLRELPRAQPSPELDARLHRIEAAVEAIRIDVERLAEAQRLGASREALRLPEPGRPSRVITPH